MCDKNNHLRFAEDEYLYHVDTVLLGFLDPENKSSRYEDLIRSKHIPPQNLSSITGGHLFFQLNGSVVNVIWLLYMQLYLITTVLDHFTLTMQQ